MPSFITSGKSKRDLVAIASQFGLLTESAAQDMTQEELADFLENEQNKAVSAAPPAPAPANPWPATPTVRRIKADGSLQQEILAEAGQNLSAADSADDGSEPSKRRGRPPRAPSKAAAAKRRGSTKTADSAPAQIALPSIDDPTSATPATHATSKSSATPLPASPATPQLPVPEATSELPDTAIVADATDEAAPVKRRGRPPGQPRTTRKTKTTDDAARKTPRSKEEQATPARRAAAKKPAPEQPAKITDKTSETTSRTSQPAEPHSLAQTVAADEKAVKSSRTAAGMVSEPTAEAISGTATGTVSEPTAETVSGTAADAVSEPVAEAVSGTAAGTGGEPTAEAISGTAAGTVSEPTAEAISGTAAASEPAEKTRKHPEHAHGERRLVVETGDVQGGVLEIMPDGYGFLRKENYLQGSKDIYVPPQYIRRFGLRMGDLVTGPVKLQRESDRFQALLYIKDVNGMAPEKMLRRPQFDKLTPIYPNERFVLETVRNELSTRIIDLIAPIGKGQRGMIVSPPKAGKTILLQKIANAVSINNPETKLIVLLIDERPEEVTDMQRSINGEVVYSTFDKTPENHTKVVELVLERALRLVELKQHVMILLDSMTRLARAYNLTINPTGRTLSGGLDPGALYGPKRFFGAARNIENGGSLTIIATSLIETGSRMDEVIFEEFKGTGNMEVYLDRKLSEKRIFPAIDLNKSGTRREELLMNTRELDAVWTIRKAFSQLDTSAVTEAIINLLLKTRNNEHFISSVNISFNDKNVFEAMRGVRPGQQTNAAGTPLTAGANGYGPQGSGDRQLQERPADRFADRPTERPAVRARFSNTGYGTPPRRLPSHDDD